MPDAKGRLGLFRCSIGSSTDLGKRLVRWPPTLAM